MKCAQVVLFRNLREFGQGLSYLVPESLLKVLKPGDLVEAPFQSKQLPGLVISISDSVPPKLDPAKLRELLRKIDSFSLTEAQLVTAQYISSYYRSSLSRALRLFLPRLAWKGRLEQPATASFRLVDSEPMVRGDRQREIIDALSVDRFLSLEELKNRLPNYSAASLKTLLKKGLIEQQMSPVYSAFSLESTPLPEPGKTLTPDQQKALDVIRHSDNPSLLHGVTGSGKTEIYLRLILDTVKNGKQAILLVPEIALTPQIVSYFRHFFNEHIAVFHSKLTDAERLKEWWKVKSGFAPLAIGSRSAVFAPADRLGLVILDEEHEWTYKQESTPYYLTHEVARKLCTASSAKLVFGSATPSAERYLAAQSGELTYVHLPERVTRVELPHISIVDLREEFRKRNFSVLSLQLQSKVRERLDRGEQIILFVNQRGLASAVVCRDCGYTEKCPSCDISLKFHKRAFGSDFGRFSEQLMCHYCTFTKEPTLTCPDCKSPHIKYMGVGTQKVEQAVKDLFPHARVIRADRDTTQGKAGFQPIYEQFLNREFDVLVGTQMIAKGLDFENVTLIGIVLADIGLHLPDFRSSERLFQITTQVAGRCGRGKERGEVVLQTYNPTHPTIERVAKYEYLDFIEQELSVRKKLSYPPFNRMVKFTVVGFDQQKLAAHVQSEKEVLEDLFKMHNLTVKVVAAPALIPKMAGQYYYHVLLRSENPRLIFDYWKPPKGWRVDVDPIHTT